MDLYYKLLDKYISNPNLKRHCYIVESCMRFYALKLGENDLSWALAGLLHDLDWELYPNEHPNKINELLISNNVYLDQNIIDAILGHGYPHYTNVPRKSLMAKYLFACDELSGFIYAYSLMRSGGFEGMNSASVIKKLKDKAFARNISRDDIYNSVNDIGLNLEEHIQNLITVMKNTIS